MKKKVTILSVLILLTVILAFFGYKNTFNKDVNNNSVKHSEKISSTETNNEVKEHNVSFKNQSKAEKQAQKITSVENDNFIKKTDLCNDETYYNAPLSVITEISELPNNVQTEVKLIAKSSNLYMIQKTHDKIIIITDNPDNIRHGIGFTEISLKNNQKSQTTLGYSDKMKDSDNDIWEYSKETNQPTKHTKYDNLGDMEFVEVWNYDPNNPVKYEMKNAEGKVISMKKETLQNGTDLRVEHLIYDKNGNTRINISATYDGEDIKRFTYYNAEKPSESGSIFSEYSDGYRTKETVYTSDLKVKNSYTSTYKDGEREEIIKWNNQNQEVQKYIPENNE